jgi:hypothetical protein
MILLSGDFHANSQNELSIIASKHLKKLFGAQLYKTINYHLILGDAGFLWPHNEKTDRYNLSVLNYRPFPILFLPGNHESIYGHDLSEFEKVDMGFGHDVYKIYNNCYYLQRGFIYNIEGLSFLVLGGALSIDKIHRTEGQSWWPQEYWSYQEEHDCLDRIKGQHIDYVVSHTGPNHVNEIFFLNNQNIVKNKFTDQVALFNDAVDEQIKFKHWFYGHFHEDVYNQEIMGKRYSTIYDTVALVDGNNVTFRP